MGVKALLAGTSACLKPTSVSSGTLFLVLEWSNRSTFLIYIGAGVKAPLVGTSACLKPTSVPSGTFFLDLEWSN